MRKKPFGIGIIGCGLIGKKRARSLGQGGKLVACADIDINSAQSIAGVSNVKVFKDWGPLLKLSEVDIVIVATFHDTLAQISLEAIKEGKHVFVEKPAARLSKELNPVIEASEQYGMKVHVGFNHRYHRSIRKAREIIDEGKLGELMFTRARYGHGARIGYDEEWRSKPNLSGGGELIDQGTHLIDLSRWFFGEFTEVQGFANTYFWKMPVDDNSFMLLKTHKKQVAFLHVSCTEWKNLFSMEIYGDKGKIELSGLGGSYGIEKITWYNLLPEMGPPETVCWEYPMEDDSWEIELAEFYEDILLDRYPASGLDDAKAALKIIENIYLESGYDNCS